MAPIIVPPTPNGELAKMLREVIQKEKDEDVNFNKIESSTIYI